MLQAAAEEGCGRNVYLTVYLAFTFIVLTVLGGKIQKLLVTVLYHCSNSPIGYQRLRETDTETEI